MVFLRSLRASRFPWHHVRGRRPRTADLKVCGYTWDRGGPTAERGIAEDLRQNVESRRTYGRTWDRGGPTVTAVAVVFRNPTRSAGPSGPADKRYWQPGNFRLSSLVCQLNEPAVTRYSPTNQNVQSSTGSTAMLV